VSKKLLEFAICYSLIYNLIGGGKMEILSVEEPIIAVRRSQYPEDNRAEFLLVGRSNVGKSSFINSLIERKNFARTSSKPGKTQTLNFYQVNKSFYLVDVPGYGYASVSKDAQKKFGMMIEEYLRTRQNLKHVFLLVDYRHKPTEDDILMYDFLKYYNLNITIVATKYDKVTKNGRVKQDKLIRETLKLDENNSFVPFSTITKKGREDILEIISSYL
jgi:GTP-binding protein